MGSNGGRHAVQEPPGSAICRLWRFFVWKGRGESGIGAVTACDGLDGFGTWGGQGPGGFERAGLEQGGFGTRPYGWHCYDV